MFDDLEETGYHPIFTHCNVCGARLRECDESEMGMCWRCAQESAEAVALERTATMTEAEWLASEDPGAMLEWIRLGNVAADEDYPPNYEHCPVRTSDRKLRLFACACCRAAGALGAGDERAWLAAEVFADGDPTPERRRALDEATWAAPDQQPPGRLWLSPGPAALYLQDGAQCAGEVVNNQQITRALDPATQAALLRDIVGNPFRPPPQVRAFGGLMKVGWLTWNNGTIPRMARAIYEGRRFSDLPMLADALEEAGCHDEGVLEHCREQHNTCPVSYPHLPHDYCDGSPQGERPARGLHARGCWVLDLLLGKE